MHSVCQVLERALDKHFLKKNTRRPLGVTLVSPHRTHLAWGRARLRWCRGHHHGAPWSGVLPGLPGAAAARAWGLHRRAPPSKVGEAAASLHRPGPMPSPLRRTVQGRATAAMPHWPGCLAEATAAAPHHLGLCPAAPGPPPLAGVQVSTVPLHHPGLRRPVPRLTVRGRCHPCYAPPALVPGRGRGRGRRRAPPRGVTHGAPPRERREIRWEREREDKTERCVGREKIRLRGEPEVVGTPKIWPRTQSLRNCVAVVYRVLHVGHSANVSLSGVTHSAFGKH